MDIDRALKKLEPLLPERVERWRQILPFVDDRTRALLQRDIVMTAHQVLGDLSQRLLLSLPPEKTARGSFHLGTVIYGTPKWPCGLHPRELLQHCLVCGRSGSGKTTTAFHLLEQCISRRVPVLFLDWKRTARHLLPYLRGRISIYTPGRSVAPLMFNPFVPPPGIEHHQYINHLVDVLSAAFTLGEGAKSMIQQALAECYSTGRWPTPREVAAVVKAKQVKSRASGWQVSAMRALESLEFSGLTADASATQEELANSLLHGNTIIELDALNHGVKTFLVPMLCLWLYYVKLAGRRREELDLLIFVEEAHHVFYRQEDRAKETTMNMILRQCRELGIGMVIIDQHPHMISSVALGNAYTSICLNQKDPVDINKAAALSLMDEEDKSWLSRLPVGHGVVKLQDRWSRPFLVRFPPATVQKGRVTDEDVGGLRRGSVTPSDLHRHKQSEFGAVGRSRVWDIVLNDDDFAFLNDVLDYPDDGVDARYRRLGISVDKGNRLKTRLLTSGIIEDYEVKVGRTRKVVLRASHDGRQALGVNTPEGKGYHESLVHEYWKRFYAAAFRERGYAVELEASRDCGRVDVLARKGVESVAIEVETGKSDVVTNVREDLSSGFAKILVVATDASALAKVNEQLARAGLIIPRRIVLTLRDEFSKTT